MKELSQVSIVIPCRNEGDYIGKCLDSVLANDYPKERLEVLVIDGMSQDSTREIVESYQKQHHFIKVLENPRRITSCALNLGIKSSGGDLILWLSAHNEYERQYISKCLRYLEEYEAYAVGGIIKPVPRKNTFIGKAVCFALSHPFGVGNSAHKTGVDRPQWSDTAFGTCYRRDVFEKVGKFNENLVRGQDMEFSLRMKKAGLKILLVPDIMSYYYARSDMRSFWKQNWNNGMWAVLPFLYSNISPIRLRHIVPLGFVVSLIGSGLLGLVMTRFLWLFLAIAIVYSLANLIASSQIAYRVKDYRYLFVMPLVFGALHFAYGLGSLWGTTRSVLIPHIWRKFLLKKKDTRGEWDRKEKEKELHDLLRGELSNEPRYMSNQKWYSISQINGDYVQKWLSGRCKGKRVLDYCCGEGAFTIWIAEAGASAFGIDISPISIQKAMEKASSKGLSNRAVFRVMDAEQTEFADDYFDLIVVNGVLHHLDLEAAYRELARILSPKGEIICTEALRHNPIIHLYRKMTPHLRSAWETEHILGRREIRKARSHFHEVKILRFFHLATIAAVPFRNSPIFPWLKMMLAGIDSILLKTPVIKWQAWMVVFVLSDAKKSVAI